MKLKKKYGCGQSRKPSGEGSGAERSSRNPKDYHRQELSFHGSQMAYDKWVDGGRKGYGK